MEIYAPVYCLKFKCIADKCKHSCCIDWEIDIDEKTLKKYEELKNDFGKNILSKIERTEDCSHFALLENGRCPNLDSRGLCKIITELGEEYLCDICRLHPRFFNRVGDRIEMGIGLSCEEAVRLVLTDREEHCLVKIGDEEESAFEKTDFNSLAVRDAVISLFESIPGSYIEKIEAIEKKYSTKTDFYENSEWIDYLLSLEILDVQWRSLLEKSKAAAVKNTHKNFDRYYENLFKYLVFRHVSTADSETSFLARLSFALFGTKLVKYLAEREENLTEARLFEIVRLFSSEIEYSEENTEDLIFELEIADM